MANYFVIGGDNKEYGPVSAEELRKWADDGRVDAQTRVRAENTTDWLPFSQVPEFAGASVKPSSPPPLPGGHPRPAARTSSLAIASLVLGIFGLFTCGGTALFGLVLGIIAMVRVTKSRGELEGKGIALAGTVVSGVFLIMLPLFLALLLPALAAAKQKAQQINCMNNEKQLALAMIMYADQHGNHLPAADAWCDAIQTNLPSNKVFQCPAANAADRCDYAFNAKLDGTDLRLANPRTVMLFDAEGAWNAHGGPELHAARHRGHFLAVAFMDGHVEIVSENRLNTLRWDP